MGVACRRTCRRTSDWAWLGCGDVGGLVGGLVEMSEDLSEDLDKTCNTSYPYRG